MHFAPIFTHASQLNGHIAVFQVNTMPWYSSRAHIKHWSWGIGRDFLKPNIFSTKMCVERSSTCEQDSLYEYNSCINRGWSKMKNSVAGKIRRPDLWTQDWKLTRRCTELVSILSQACCVVKKIICCIIYGGIELLQNFETGLWEILRPSCRCIRFQACVHSCWGQKKNLQTCCLLWCNFCTVHLCWRIYRILKFLGQNSLLKSLHSSCSTECILQALKLSLRGRPFCIFLNQR